MRLLPIHLRWGLGILFGVVTATAYGQPSTPAKPTRTTEPASVHRIVIFEGPNRSVHYVASGNLPAGDRRAAYDLERAENELTYLHDLQRLKQQYVNSERIMEPQRRYVQEQLYGTQIRYSGSGTSYGGYGSGGWGYGSYSPYAYGGYGNYYGNRGNFTGYVGSNSYSVVRSLQFGMGDEGRFKDAMVQVIAKQASPEYAATVRRQYEDSVAAAGASPTLAKALSLPKSEARPAEVQGPYKKGARLTVTLKDKEKITGTVEADGPEWLVLRTADSRMTIRKAEILRYAEPLAAPK
jgi:hypothetical protein